MHVLFFDRKIGDIHGVVTLQQVTMNHGAMPIFKRLPAASGQYAYTDGQAEDWVPGKGPTPFGTHWLSTKREALQMEPVGTPFYIISTNRGERVIHGPGGHTRGDIGLHLENRFPGTAGCCALLHDTPEREKQAWALLDYLDKIHADEPYIRMVVL